MAIKSIKKVYLDMDGVLADFDKRLDDAEIPKDLTRAEFWERIKTTPRFWTKMDLMPGANQLVNFVRKLKVPIEILTAPVTSDPKCKPGKLVWARAHSFNFPIHFKRAQDKYKYAEPGAVLIDDLPETIEAWNKAGGIGIVHTSVGQTVYELQKILQSNNEYIESEKDGKNETN